MSGDYGDGVPNVKGEGFFGVQLRSLDTLINYYATGKRTRIGWARMKDNPFRKPMPTMPEPALPVPAPSIANIPSQKWLLVPTLPAPSTPPPAAPASNLASSSSSVVSSSSEEGNPVADAAPVIHMVQLPQAEPVPAPIPISELDFAEHTRLQRVHDMRIIFTTIYKFYLDGTQYDVNIINLTSAFEPFMRPLRNWLNKMAGNKRPQWYFCSELVFVVLQELQLYPAEFNAQDVLPMDLLGLDTDKKPIPALFNPVKTIVNQ